MLSIKVHRINGLVNRRRRLRRRSRLSPIRTLIESDEGLVGSEERSRESVAPIDTETRTSDLDPTMNVGHERQFTGKDLAEEEVDTGDASMTEMVLDEGHGMWITLSTERAEDETPSVGGACGGDGLSS